MRLDLDFVRSRFPAFDAGSPARDLAFFENAGGSYACRPVVERLTTFMTATKVQPYGPFALSERAGEAMDEGYRAIGDLLGTDPERLTLGPSSSANTYVLAHALRHLVAPGDEVVVTNQDHEANVGCWRRMCERAGGVVREWRVDDHGELHLADLEALVGPRTRIVAMSLCSNLVGTLNPVAAAAGIAHRHGALLVGDAVSYAPHAIPEVERSGLDFCFFSTYKVFATHVGVLWGSEAGLDRTQAQGHYFNADKPRYRLNPTGPQHAEIAALGGLATYVDEIYAHHHPSPEAPARSAHDRALAVWDLFRDHEARLAARLLAGVAHLPGLRVLGEERDVTRRAAVVSLVPTRVAASRLARALGERGVAVRNGHFYALRLVEALGLDPAEGVLRISMVHYNSEADVDRLLSGLGELLA